MHQVFVLQTVKNSPLLILSLSQGWLAGCLQPEFIDNCFCLLIFKLANYVNVYFILDFVDIKVISYNVISFVVYAVMMLMMSL